MFEQFGYGFWGALLSVFVLLSLLTPVRAAFGTSYDWLAGVLHQVFDQYRFFELSAVDQGILPTAPTEKEKYAYSHRNHRILLLFSAVSFSAISFSMTHFLINNTAMRPLFIFLVLTVIYFFISFTVNAFTKSFDMQGHKRLVQQWRPNKYPTVDIFLPICGESIAVLRNTWLGVQQVQASYPGRVTIYCLDDADQAAARQLAGEFGFNYVVRSNRGEFKKAGNLRNGFNISDGDFIVIFDADFRPRYDFLQELLPYMEANPKIGIVQSPQYFDVTESQGWLERGAGAVQELFYRFSQVSRQSHDASICVGSNALYRRRALQDTGGTALIEHSEDVHTGFNLRMHGWTIQYVPVNLAKGLCPAGMNAFFKQQYRWCMGSMSLLTSQKFWEARLPLRTRMSYFSGFMYYIHTGLTSFVGPLVPLVLLVDYPEQIALHNYIFVLPAFILTQFVYPIWHNAPYGIEAWATRTIYGWAHLFAIYDKVTGHAMGWQPTGSKIKRDTRYTNFRVLQFLFNFLPAVAWVDIATYRMVTAHSIVFLPITLSGLYYLAIVAKVTFYSEVPVHIQIRKPTLSRILTNRAYELPASVNT